MGEDMDVFVRGSRSSAQDWRRAQQIPLSEIPPLNEEQKAAARRENVSEENYARSAYAARLTEQATLQKLKKFGQWLGAKVERWNPGSCIDLVELDTWSGKYLIQGKTGTEPFSIELDEDLVERFLTTGAADLERAIFRVLEIFVPIEKEAKAS
jgi:hypothetical protein